MKKKGERNGTGSIEEKDVGKCINVGKSGKRRKIKQFVLG